MGVKYNRLVVIVLFLSFFAYICDSKVFTRCGFRDELIRRKFPKSFISNWVCLVDSESGRNTTKISVGTAGSHKFGIFQISSKDYCKKGSAGGLCNVKCEDLLSDDITKDVECAKLMYDRQGFRGWSGWERGCKNRNLDTYVAHCRP